MENMTVKQWLGLGIKLILAAIVIGFEVSLSLEFFGFIYPVDKWYMAYMGLGLTSGAMLGYMYLFAFDTKTNLQRMLALVMMIASIIASIIVAGFGMQVEAWRKAGFTMAQSDIDFMIMAIRVLLFIHGAVLALYFTGDRIVVALGDADGDGIPNFVDKDYKQWKSSQKSDNNPTAELQRLREENARLRSQQAAPAQVKSFASETKDETGDFPQGQRGK